MPTTLITGFRSRTKTPTGRLGLLWLLLILASAAQADTELTLQAYPAFGSQQGFQVQGRLLREEPPLAAQPNDSWWRNLRRSLKQWLYGEAEAVPVQISLGAQHWSAITDDEGNFQLSAVPAANVTAGWHKLVFTADGVESKGQLLLVPEANTLGIISDIDDTVLVSNVGDKSELLANTFLKNPLQREAVPGVAAFYAKLMAANPRPAAAPIIYLSASPRQLAGNIQSFLDHNHFPPGVLVAKQLGGNDPVLDQLAYKTTHIEDIMQRLPWVRWILVGDDGEKDPETYAGIQQRFPQQVAAVYIRRVNQDPNRVRFPGQVDLQGALSAP